MRYHFDKPEIYLSMYGSRYICDHPVYNSCTLYKIGEKGLAVIQQRFNEETKSTGMSKGIKIAAGVGLSVIVGFVVYKYVAKPVIANIKTQIELKKMAAEEKTIIVDETDVSTEEN